MLETEKRYSEYLAAEHRYLSSLKEAEGEVSNKKIVISILREISVEPFLPIIRFQLLKIFDRVEFNLFEFGSIQEQAYDTDSDFYSTQCDLVLILTWEDAREWSLFNSTNEHLVSIIDEKSIYLEKLLQKIRQHKSCPILLNNYLKTPHGRVANTTTAKSQMESFEVEDLNRRVSKQIKKIPSVYISDLATMVYSHGFHSCIDEVKWNQARLPFTKFGMETFSKTIASDIRSISGQSKKCLILDCDNTIWGGVIGEDGMSGISLGPQGKGKGYYDLQRYAVNLSKQGVFITLASKNNEHDVLQVLREHPDCVLREEHISTYRINWEDKATNIQQISEELNIGLDAVVFCDDSKFECDWIRKNLPDVEVIHLNGNSLDYLSMLMQFRYFEKITNTEEDYKRTKMFKAQKKREIERKENNFENYEDYLNSLQLRVEWGRVTSKELERTLQLINKTNQFNFTTKRYSLAELERALGSKDEHFFWYELEDRFSTLGLVGIACLYEHTESLDINNILISCRALGRGLEDAIMKSVWQLAIKKNKRSIRGHYLSSNKNSQVKDFYSERQFTPIASNGSSDFWEFRLGDEQLPFKLHPWMSSVENEIEN